MPVNTQWIYSSAADENPWVAASPDLVFPKYVFVEVLDDPDIEVDVKIRAFFNRTTRRYDVDSIQVLRRPQWGSVIDGSALRDIRVKDMLRRGLAQAGHVKSRDGEKLPNPLPEDLVAKLRNAGPSNDETLRWVARIYIRAWALHQNPASEVQDQLHLTRPTTSVWLRRARDRGFLVDPADLNDLEPALTAAEYEQIREALDD